MFEKMFKGMFVLTVWGFILIAVAALLPDSAWESFPEKLLPVRDFLAEKNIISSQFRSDNRASNGLTKKNQGVQTSLVPSQAGLAASKVSQELPRQSFTGMASVPASPATVSENNAGDSKLVIPPFPQGDGAAELDKNSDSLADTASKPREPQGTNPASPAEPGINVSGSPKAQASTGDIHATGSSQNTMASNPENSVKKKSNDTLPELSFDSTSPLAGLGTEQTLSIDTALLTVPGDLASKTVTPATGLSDPLAGTAKTPIPEKPIENATLPDTGIISTTSATNANATPFPNAGNLNLDKTSLPATAAVNPASANPAPASPVLANPAQAAATVPAPPVNAAPLVNSSQELVQALVLAQNPNEMKTAFFKLNQLLERYGETYSATELEQLHKALDRMAFTVFYDPKQHVLEPPYVTSAGDTLVSIAGTYKITPEHLAALNGLSGPQVALTPGTKLKVVRGPVSANVSMSKKELLLLYDGLYAGRFRMGLAANAKALRGILAVTRKIASPQYIGPLENGTQGEIAGGDPRNPLGPFWIELNNGLGLQGTNHPEFVGNETAQQGGLIFSNKDITHLNILLPSGANVYLKD